MQKEILYNEEDFRKPITDRIKSLRNEVLKAKPILCSERAKIVTESYKQTESYHPITRRAEALKAILEQMTQNIWDGELIVGSHGSNGRRSAPVYPEFAIEWLETELDEELESREQDQFIVPEQVKKDLQSIFPYWRNKTLWKTYRNLLPEETKVIRDSYMFTRDLFERNGYGHTAYQLEKIMAVGIVGLKKEVEEKLLEIDITTAIGLEQKLFYEGLIVTFDAVVSYAKRYSQKALSLAEQEEDASRKKELIKIADVCSWVPENPCRDIWDAIQVTTFMQIIIQTETNGDSVSPGRLDQYLYPYYKKDIEDKRYSIGEVQELLDCLWVKFNEIIKVQDSESIYIHPGFPMTPNLTIGGQTSEGKDAVNEVSYLMLTSQEHILLTNPQFTARFFKGTPREFKLRVAEVISHGTGMPAMFGDEGCMKAIHKALPDMPIERVRDYSIVGCVELSPKGFQGRVNGGQLNIARIVDLALNNGVDRLTSKQLGPETGNSESLKTFDDFLNAVRIQMDFFIKHQVINAVVVDYVQRTYTPHLFLSSLIEGCIENGKDMTSGGSLWGATPILHAGEATAADSLVAIKKLVYDESTISLETLNKILDQDFDGIEGETIQKLLLGAPKYGNDNDYADSVMTEMTNMLFDEIEKFKDIDGNPYTSMILTLGGNVPHGWKTGATANGRKATMPVSDSMSPSNLGTSEGPTAVLLSASKIDQARVLEGNVLNLKFSKDALKGEASNKLIDLVSTYFHKLEGQEVQVNVVDSAVLRDAQKHPENYQNLVIRVAGYSARFVELAKELQNDIINRQEHDSVGNSHAVEAVRWDY